MSSLSDRLHDVDLELEQLVGKRVRCSSHCSKSPMMKGLEVPGCVGIITALRWHSYPPRGWMLEIQTDQGKQRTVPAETVAVARRIIKGKS